MAERAPGFENYTPSRLEWLAVLLNSLLPYIYTDEEINKVYVPKDDGKTIVLMVRYPKDLDSKIVEEHIEHMKEHIKELAAINKWDSWLEIEVIQSPV